VSVSTPIAPLLSSAALRRLWLTGTVALSLVAVAGAIALAPSGSVPPGRALQWLLFVGSSVHVAATGWFFTVPEVRAYAKSHPGRYLVTPGLLVAGGASVAALVPASDLTWLLLPFFGWQFFHFQKQNLGLAALAGVSCGIGSVRPAERRAIVAAGLAGIVGLVVHPELLQLAVRPPFRWAFPVAAAAFAFSVLVGLIAVARRPAAQRRASFLVVYALSLGFFLPVFVFASPYAAVAGLTIAHGYQYLLIVGLVAGGRRDGRSPAVSLVLLINIALLGGLGLNVASHLHDGVPAVRLIFGAYLGILMAHFVVDAGLWRLRDRFPRTFLTERLPYLLVPADRG
jgi:hypothetical protein